jgi:hypothetical protein
MKKVLFFYKFVLLMKKNKNKILLLFVVCAFLLGSILFFYVYKEHRDISKESAKFTITVDQLHEQFQVNDSLSNATYADQTIIVSGIVSSIDSESNAVILDEKLYLTFNINENINFQSNQSVKIKGRFVGYDDLLDELKMDQCKLIE